ncbi:MAG: cytochrome c oxidase assembly protein [Pseudomonadota bacterium]
MTDQQPDILPQAVDKERDDPRRDQQALAAKNARTMLYCMTFVALMVGVSFAAVPLYELFCRVTGFGGTTQVADAELDDSAATGRMISVRFNADTDPRLPWKFQAEQTEIDVEIGRSAMAYYTIENRTARPSTGMAVYNVTPLKAGKYFHKVQCFCFDEQTLEAGAAVDMPVLFYVDPEILEDRKMNDVDTITLSYTFFNAGEDLQDKVGAFYEMSEATGAMVGGHVGSATN